MIELWTKDQILAELPDEDFWNLWKEIHEHIHDQPPRPPIGKNFGKWKLLELKVVPTESVSMVLRLEGKSLILRAESLIDQITRTQVFHRRRMITVEDYVDLKTKQADPGVSTTFG